MDINSHMMWLQVLTLAQIPVREQDSLFRHDIQIDKRIPAYKKDRVTHIRQGIPAMAADV